MNRYVLVKWHEGLGYGIKEGDIATKEDDTKYIYDCKGVMVTQREVEDTEHWLKLEPTSQSMYDED